MNVTKREFRIAAAASFFGFLLCYFLFGQSSAPRGPSQMVLIASLSNAPVPLQQLPRDFHLQGPTNVRTIGFQSLPAESVRSSVPGFKSYRARDVNLISSRYRIEVDLRDLQ